MTSKRKSVPKKIKDRLLVDAMHRCCLCPQHEDMTHIHHIVPINEKGPNTEDNLMVVCPTCHEKIHRIRGRYTPEQLRMYKERWVSLCAKGLTLEERLAEEPGINLFIKPILQRGKSGKQGKAYPYLKALLDGLIEAAPNWMKAPAKVVSSLSEQLKDKGKEENKVLEKEIQSISEDELRTIIGEAGWEQREDIKFIAGRVKLIPEILPKLDYRFDKVDEKLEEIKSILQRKQPVVSTKEQHAGRDIIQAGRDIIIQQAAEKEKLDFPFEPSLHNQTPPEESFVGREEEIEIITKWYKSPDVRIGALIGGGGVGKTALVRKWYDSLGANKIRPDGILWWNFYDLPYLEQFLNALLRYASQGQVKVETFRSTWEKMEWIKEYIRRGVYLIILDGLEQMQRGKESGEKYGKMIQHEFKEMLHYLVDAKKSEGLCLITTRYELKDINKWDKNGFEWEQIRGLSVNDSVKMLKVRRIKGTDEDLKEVAKRYKKHPLSLTSTAGYLDRYYDGEIKQAPDVEFVQGDEERFKDVNKLLGKYAERMSEAERRFLNIFSLFRQEVTERDFVGVFRKRIESAMFNDAIVEMNELDFRDMINGLVDWRLISYDQMKKTYTAHPLIKSYFESDFEERNKKLCHQSIYAYFGENAPERPDTLEEMQPLFEQVYHGCAAGFYQETLDVFYTKIDRSGEHFLYYKLGAWETELYITKTFFPEGDLSKMPLVKNMDAQSFLLNEAGLALLNIGRPKEAEELFIRKTKMQIEDRDWTNASGGYQNLAELQFRIGEIESGMESAKKALEMSEKVEYDKYIMVSKAWLGWIFYLLGESEEGEKQFSEADKLSQKITGYRIHSIWASLYADFLMSIKEIDKAFELERQNLEISRNILKNPNDISRCHQCLGAIERIKGNPNESESNLQKALEIARKIGVPFLEIEALLEYGRLWLDLGKKKDAVRDANEVLKICGRTGFRFYEPGAEIVLGKAYLAEKDFKQAKTFAKSAYEKAASMKYRWAEGDAADLLGEIYSVRGDKAKARKWLKKAVGCRKEILDPKVKESEGKLAGSE